MNACELRLHPAGTAFELEALPLLHIQEKGLLKSILGEEFESGYGNSIGCCSVFWGPEGALSSG